eukprot:CAMPEP_0172450238 /NCGR_PEP_ID=MMETSP1065-20121228/8670_1 /TAXON_ID=265537 /ORGANISM="Amphiprora paludosa, Strain CCMP125" /LENGTH=641 /DNA_ID=CAMNT_0013202017 /DNA_START=604 /DNA_END=2532 /DNA_ORIENTATION=-
MTSEVTAYPSPLALAPIDLAARQAHSNACQLHRMKSDLSKSHTVFVIDCSGSMLTHDIHLHRDRQVAAFTMTALEFIAEQLFNGTSNNKDLISLVEFGETARVVFSHEPVSWVLYNKLLERRDSRNYQDREIAKLQEFLQCDSNYLPALDSAGTLLSKGDHEDLALCLFFLSDGQPSDPKKLGISASEAEQLMCTKVEDLSKRFGYRLTANFVGFGNELMDFSTLRRMEATVNAVTDGAKAEFFYCAKMAHSIGEAATSMVTSMTQTRLAISSGGARASPNLTHRSLVSEDDTPSFQRNDWRYLKILNHLVFDQNTQDWVHHSGLPPGASSELFPQQSRAKTEPPPFLAINTLHCGHGVERVAFRSYLANSTNATSFVFGAMVAKETLCVERIEENIEFHKGFLETQSLSASLAEEFNKRILALEDMNIEPCRIIFLPCSVLLVNDPSWKGGKRGVLVEKMLDSKGWTKWNNNAGAVDGKIQHIPLNVEKELEKLKNKSVSFGLGMIEEGDSDDNSEASSDDEEEDEVGTSAAPTTKPSDYLQAFSHFTYLYTNKKVLVCDLQGVYNAEAKPCPMFELTDPAIHYASKHRRMVFGRTDKGRKGHGLFFETHKCNPICKFLALSRRNKNWQKKWRDAGLYGL